MPLAPKPARPHCVEAWLSDVQIDQQALGSKGGGWFSSSSFVVIASSWPVHEPLADIRWLPKGAARNEKGEQAGAAGSAGGAGAAPAANLAEDPHAPSGTISGARQKTLSAKTKPFENLGAAGEKVAGVFPDGGDYLRVDLQREEEMLLLELWLKNEHLASSDEVLLGRAAVDLRAQLCQRYTEQNMGLVRQVFLSGKILSPVLVSSCAHQVLCHDCHCHTESSWCISQNWSSDLQSERCTSSSDCSQA